MTEHLKRARAMMRDVSMPTEEPGWYHLHMAVNQMLLHMESQSQPPMQETLEPPSSAATETPAGTKPISLTSSNGLFRVSLDGTLTQFLADRILVWPSSHLPHGVDLEVEIGVTLTSKAATPPSGSRSPSMQPLTPNANESSFSSGAPGMDALPESSSRVGPEPTGARGAEEVKCGHRSMSDFAAWDPKTGICRICGQDAFALPSPASTAEKGAGE